MTRLTENQWNVVAVALVELAKARGIGDVSIDIALDDLVIFLADTAASLIDEVQETSDGGVIIMGELAAASRRLLANSAVPGNA